MAVEAAGVGAYHSFAGFVVDVVVAVGDVKGVAFQPEVEGIAVCFAQGVKAVSFFFAARKVVTGIFGRAGDVVRGVDGVV